MKKTIIIALSLSILLVIASCRKPTSTVGGTWTLNSQTYTATQAYFVVGNLTAYTGTGVPTGSLSLTFYDSISNATLAYIQTLGNDSVSRPNFTWPPKHRSYILTNVYPPDSGYVYMQLTDSSLYNSYVITGSTTPSVTVDTAKGLATVIIPPVMVWNINSSFYSAQLVGAPSYTDSSLVTGKIIQTQ